MDSHHLFGIGTTQSASSAVSPYTSSFPNKLIGALKFELGNSPPSPFSFDSDTTVSDYASSSSAAENSPLDTDTFFSNFTLPPNQTNANPNPNPNPNPSQRGFRHALLELESALMSPDDEDEAAGKKRQRGDGNYSAPSDLKQLLIDCAAALSENDADLFERLIETARSAVSISGEPLQRLGAYMVEGMVARREASGPNIYRSLRCRDPPESEELLSYMQILYEICPYLKFGYMAANGAIAEACRNEDRIHIIDFQIGQGTQWLTLLQALAARPNGPPHVRITGIDDPMSRHARGEGLTGVARRLSAVSDQFNIPVEFHAVPVFAADVTAAMLGVRPGEAVAVNFPLQLHHTPDESVDVTNPRDGVLRMVKSLGPRVVTLVEQESNTNTTPFRHRFAEALGYYLAMFESIDVALPRGSKHRIDVEQHCLARDIVNVVACEGRDRVERHELFGKWKSRLTMAGFRQYPLSSYVNSVIRRLLKCYSDHYTLAESDGAMLLGWKERSLISASAWH